MRSLAQVVQVRVGACTSFANCLQGIVACMHSIKHWSLVDMGFGVSGALVCSSELALKRLLPDSATFLWTLREVLELPSFFLALSRILFEHHG